MVGLKSASAKLTRWKSSAKSTPTATLPTAPASRLATTASITAINDDIGAITGALANAAVTDDDAPYLTGTLSQALQTGEHLSIYRHDGTTTTKITGINGLQPEGTSWSYSDRTSYMSRDSGH